MMHYGENPPPHDPSAPQYLWDNWRTNIPEAAPPSEEHPFLSNAKAIIGISVVALIAYLMFFSGTAPQSKDNQQQWREAHDGVRH